MSNLPLVDRVRKAGTILTALLQRTSLAAQPGTMLMELEAQAQDFLDDHGVTGAFKGFNGFPANLCLSVNDCVVHGIPDETVLELGDVLKIDVGVNYEGGIADAAVSIIIGGVDHNPKADKLIMATKASLDGGLKHVESGKSLYGFGKYVGSTINAKGFKVLEYLTGHGVGETVHQAPSIYNRANPIMKRQFFTEGMIVALEPISSYKSTSFVEGDNGRNIYTKHGDIGVQWEYTVFIGPDGPEILAGVQDPRSLYA